MNINHLSTIKQEGFSEYLCDTNVTMIKKVSIGNFFFLFDIVLFSVMFLNRIRMKLKRKKARKKV